MSVPNRAIPFRLPTSEECEKLIADWLNDYGSGSWNGVWIWTTGQATKYRLAQTARYFNMAYLPTDRYDFVGLCPVFPTFPQIPTLKKGQAVAGATLYMDGKPVKISSDISEAPRYIPGSTLTFGPPLHNPEYTVWVINCGDVMISDRALVSGITWEEAEAEALASMVGRTMCIPTMEEWRTIVNRLGSDSKLLNWENVFSWLADSDPDNQNRRLAAGYLSKDFLSDFPADRRNGVVGIRPIFRGAEHLYTELQDGEAVALGTLFMGDKCVHVSEHPIKPNDIPKYIPGTFLSFRPLAEEGWSHIKVIKVGDYLVTDRVLLRGISWNEAAKYMH